MHPKLSDIILHARRFSENMILQMPKNTNIINLSKVINDSYGPAIFSIDQILLNSKGSQLYIFLGSKNLTKINPGAICEVLYDAFEIQTKEQRSTLKE